VHTRKREEREKRKGAPSSSDAYAGRTAREGCGVLSVSAARAGGEETEQQRERRVQRFSLPLLSSLFSLLSSLFSSLSSLLSPLFSLLSSDALSVSAARAGGVRRRRHRAAVGETLFSLLSSLFSLLSSLSSLFSSLFSLLSFLSYCSRGALRVAASPLLSCPLCRYCRSALGCEADSLACALLRSKSLSLPLTYLGLKVGHWRIPSHRRREMDGQRRN